MKKLFFIFNSILLFASLSFGEEFTYLKDPFESLNARIKPLLGRDLSRSEYEEHNPYFSLRYEKLPSLDIVFLSTLVITRDFVGSLTLNLLKRHAETGTQIYFMVTHQLVHKKEKKWLKDFCKFSENIHCVVYSFTSNKDHSYWTKIQSSNHVKVFATYSNNKSENNVFITGGRNVSDMYFYEQKPDHTKFPNIVHWGEKKYEWAYFDDLDLLLKDKVFIENRLNDLLSYFNNRGLKGSGIKFTPAGIGSVLSIPSESSILEDQYILNILTARERVRIISPYLNFTPKILRALLFVRSKGVRIEILTAKSVENDYLPIFLQPAMNKNLRQILSLFNIYLYSFKDFIPHAKMLLIDKTFLSIGSVNMNRRSFIYDTEFTILSSNIENIKKADNIFDNYYLKKSFQVDQSYVPPYSPIELIIPLFQNSF